MAADEMETDVLVLGAGSAGLYALPEIKKAGKRFLMANGGPMGTTCARVGCMPSKVLIQAAEDLHRKGALAGEGIRGGGALAGDPALAMEHVREIRDTLVGRLLDKTVPKLGDRLLEGYGRFREPGLVELEDGRRIRAGATVIAAGSRPVVPGPWKEAFGDRLLTTDTLFEQETLPRRMAVLGLGAIGLEMGQALARLGIEVVGVDMLETIGGLQDPEVNRVAVDAVSAEFPCWLGAKAELEEAGDGGITVRAGSNEAVVDKVLVCLGRRPNTDTLDLPALGLDLDDRGMPGWNPETGQVADLPVFIAGDVNGHRAFLHEAGIEGRIAGWNAARWPEAPTRFERPPTLAVTFCDPNVAQVGES